MDLGEFQAWLAAGRDDLAVSDDDDADAAGADDGEKAGAGLFSAAAAQLRAALLERCGVTGGATSADEARQVRDEFGALFRAIDADASGEIDGDEFTKLVSSIGVEVVDAAPGAVDLGVREEAVLLAVDLVPAARSSEKGPLADAAEHLAAATEEREAPAATTLSSLGCVVAERCAAGAPRSLTLSGVRTGSAAAAAGAAAGDVVASVCGTSIAELGANFGDEFLDKHPLDALTRRCDAALGKSGSKTATLGVTRKTARRISRAHVDVLWRAVDADGSGGVALSEIEQFVLDARHRAGVPPQRRRGAFERRRVFFQMSAGSFADEPHCSLRGNTHVVAAASRLH